MRCLPRAMPITQAAARENKLATEGVSVGLCNIPMAAHVAHTWSDNDYCIKRAIVSTGTIRGVFCWKAFTFLGKLEESTTRRSRCKYCSLLFRLNTRKRLQSEEPPLLQKSAADSQRFASSLSMWSIKKKINLFQIIQARLLYCHCPWPEVPCSQMHLKKGGSFVCWHVPLPEQRLGLQSILSTIFSQRSPEKNSRQRHWKLPSWSLKT